MKQTLLILVVSLAFCAGVQASGVSVYYYGAVGNGVTDDTQAIKNAIASGSNIEFDAGKTYLISGTLQLLPNQIVYGNNATLKRAAEASTVTSTGPTYNTYFTLHMV